MQGNKIFNFFLFEGLNGFGNPLGRSLGHMKPSDDGMNLFISPSISGKTFRIGIPYYATSVDIYNKIGNLVRKAMIDKNEFIWNGMDERGKFLPQGVYFIKASGDGKTEVRKVLLIK